MLRADGRGGITTDVFVLAMIDHFMGERTNSLPTPI
jgi:hypothetical protein